MVIGAIRVSVSDDASDAMLEKQGFNYTKYLEYLDHFPSDVGAVVVVENLLCSDRGWKLIQEVEQAYRAHPHVRKTISIASPSARYIKGNESSIDLRRFNEIQLADQLRCTKAYQYEPFRDLLVAQGGKAIAIYIVAERGLDTLSFSTSVEQLRDEYLPRAHALGGNILVTGDPIMSSEIARVISRDMLYIIALVLLLIFVTLLITQSVRTCIASLLTMTLSLAGAFGFMGWLQLDLTPGTALAIFLLGPLSAAFVIHAHGYAARDLESSIIPREAVLPTIFAGITTATLFACTALTPAPDVRSLAMLGVIGIGFATLSLFLVVYPLLAGSKNLGYTIQFSIPRWAIVRPWVAYVLLGVFIIEIVLGFSKIRFEYEAVDYLPMSNAKRAEFERIGTWFGRMNIPLMIEGKVGIEDLSIWRSLNELEVRIENKLPGVHSASFYKQLSTVTQAFTEDGSGQTLLFPEDKQLLQQLLILFDPEDYDSYIGDENQRLVATLQVPFIGSSDYFALKELVADHFLESDFQGNLVGRVSGFFETGHRIGLDNLRGLALGAVLVFLLLIYAFRSLSLSLIGLLVNSIPVLTSLGALGLLNVPIDLGSSIVAAMAFGIVVDDSTHLIIRIRRLQKAGYDPSTAVIRAIRELIAPIMTTTAMTCLGFSVLFAAEMQPFHDFATTIMIAMLTALLADLIILPVLVREFVKDKLLINV
jgi:predicted RND superfamily exporter protein